MQTDNIQSNLSNHVFYHGTGSSKNARSIRYDGFVSFWKDDEHYCQNGGVLGNGIYMTCNWKTALWFGPVLLQVRLKEGTRIVDASKPADPAKLKYLKREFGMELLKTTDLRKVIPKNKHLTQSELICLTRYHYFAAHEKHWDRANLASQRWLKIHERHLKSLSSCVSLLKQYGYHGYGNPEDLNGIVIFASDRIIFERKVIHIKDTDAYQLLYENDYKDITLKELETKYG